MQQIKIFYRYLISNKGMTGVFKNTSILFFIRILGYLIPFMVYPYLSRVLGVTGLGTYAMAVSVSGFILIITDFGFSVSGAQWIARHRKNKDSVAEYLASVLLLKIFLTLGCFLFIMLAMTIIPSLIKLQSLMLPVGFLLGSQSFQSEWIFQGMEKLSLVIYPFLISRIFFIISIFALVSNKHDVILAINLLSFSHLLALLISSYQLHKMGFFLIMPAISQVKQLVYGNVMFFLSRISSGIYNSASTFIVGLHNGSHAAGIYSAAEKLYQAGQALSSPLSQALYPYVTRTGDRGLLYILVCIVIIPLIILCLLLSVFAGEIISLIYGDAFITAASILKIFLICSVVSFVSMNFGYPAFSAINRVNVANATVMAGGFLQLNSLVVLALAGRLNSLTVAGSILLTEIIVLFLRLSLFFCLLRKNNL